MEGRGNNRRLFSESRSKWNRTFWSTMLVAGLIRRTRPEFANPNLIELAPRRVEPRQDVGMGLDTESSGPAHTGYGQPLDNSHLFTGLHSIFNSGDEAYRAVTNS